MGDIADEHRERYEDSLAMHHGGFCDCPDACEFPPLYLLRKMVHDQGLERDKQFGDDLVEFLEKRQDMSRAAKFFDRWRPKNQH